MQENKQILTIEESIELRDEIRNQEIKFDELLKSKDKEIEKQKSIIDNGYFSINLLKLFPSRVRT